MLEVNGSQKKALEGVWWRRGEWCVDYRGDRWILCIWWKRGWGQEVRTDSLKSSYFLSYRWREVNKCTLREKGEIMRWNPSQGPSIERDRRRTCHKILSWHEWHHGGISTCKGTSYRQRWEVYPQSISVGPSHWLCGQEYTIGCSPIQLFIHSRFIQNIHSTENCAQKTIFQTPCLYHIFLPLNRQLTHCS